MIQETEFQFEGHESGYERKRLIRPKEALRMKSREGVWFEVVRGDGAAGRSGASAMAAILRQRLPRWYGGLWEARNLDDKVYARYVGPVESAA